MFVTTKTEGNLRRGSCSTTDSRKSWGVMYSWLSYSTDANLMNRLSRDVSFTARTSSSSSWNTQNRVQDTHKPFQLKYTEPCSGHTQTFPTEVHRTTFRAHTQTFSAEAYRTTFRTHTNLSSWRTQTHVQGTHKPFHLKDTVHLGSLWISSTQLSFYNNSLFVVVLFIAKCFGLTDHHQATYIEFHENYCTYKAPVAFGSNKLPLLCAILTICHFIIEFTW
jgi:hypothetical protein